MTRFSFVALPISLLLIATSSYASSPDPEEFQQIYQGTWIQPAESTIPNNQQGDMIRYGRTLLNETYKYLGGGSQTQVKFTGNKLACTNCHIENGTKPNSGPWVTSYQKYAGAGKYSSRTNEYRTLPIRINGCMQRSMAGSPLPEDSYEMLSIVEYFKWLDTGIQVADWQDVNGQGMPGIPDLARAADPVRGAEIYRDECRTCHGDNGQGRWEEDEEKFRYPALWGPNSYNNGAGMYRLRTAVGFVKNNMPYGKEDLTDQEAWDVTAFINSQARPEFANHLNDWTGYGPDGMPLWMKKRVDAAYPNYWPRSDGSDNLSLPAMFTPEQHKYGPFQPLLDMQQQLQSEWQALNQ
ncbi:c-type cytochrome [Vibrio sp.]|uniref:c-type cytochrome n=1 Tax=Vibrio sp. TaxID=678 RepID=UPI003D138B31